MVGVHMRASDGKTRSDTLNRLGPDLRCARVEGAAVSTPAAPPPQHTHPDSRKETRVFTRAYLLNAPARLAAARSVGATLTLGHVLLSHTRVVSSYTVENGDETIA